jgi:uridine phosphorylase
MGTVVTQDNFYPSLMDTKLELYSKARCLAVEMEISALYVTASLENVRATACVVLDGSPLEWDKGNYDPSPERLQGSMSVAIESALKTLSQ